MTKRWISALSVALIAAVTVVAGDVQSDATPDLKDVKCVVASRDAQASKSADFKKGKVYFCCGGCAGKFASTPKKYAVQANRQLVQTKQYKQTACPLSGGKLDPETAVKVNGTEVSFCCGNCKAKVEDAKGEAQAKMVFGEKAFAKAFKPAKSEG